MLDPSIYYSDFYWNDLKIVEDHLNRLISGKNDVDYIENFRLKSLKIFFISSAFPPSPAIFNL